MWAAFISPELKQLQLLVRISGKICRMPPETITGLSRPRCPALPAFLSTCWHPTKGPHGLHADIRTCRNIYTQMCSMLTFTHSHTCRTIYTQMSSMFVTQGSVMQRDIPWGDSTVKVPSASMAVFNTVAIIVLVGHAERLL